MRESINKVNYVLSFEREMISEYGPFLKSTITTLPHRGHFFQAESWKKRSFLQLQSERLSLTIDKY